MASETSTIALRSEEIRKEMPVATASGGGVANLSHDLFLILLYFIKKNCIQRNRFYNGIVSEIKLFPYNKIGSGKGLTTLIVPSPQLVYELS